MKLKKYLVLPVAATGSLYLTSCGDKGAEKVTDALDDAKAAVADVTGTSSYVDSSAANYKKGQFSDYSKLITQMIEESAGKDMPEGMTSQHILDFTGLGNVETYEQSSTPDGTEWINQVQFNNGGKHAGALKLITDTKYDDHSVANMAPEGTDLAFQMGMNFASLEEAVLSFMKNGAPEADIEEFKNTMGEQAPMLGMTNSELLKQLDLRVNLALDMDPAEQLPTPFGSFDKPNLVIRLDGIGWIWEKVGPMAIGGTGMPFQKAEENGVTTYSLPAEMAAQFMGYSPQVRVDSSKDQVWIASTPAFMAKCTSGTNTLASSSAYQETMKGLPTKGQALTYMSKDFTQFASKLIGDLKDKGMLDSADPSVKTQLETALAQLNKVDKGYAQVLSTNKDGIHIADRGVQNNEQKMAEMHKTIQQLKDAAK